MISGKKENITVISIETTDLDLQLNQVLKQLKIDKKSILSRCTLCNTELERVDKSIVKGKVPSKVFENNENFLFLLKCQQEEVFYQIQLFQIWEMCI